MTDRDPKADSVEPSQLERELFVQGPTIVFRWAPEEDWPVRFASPNCLDVLGYSVAELEAGSPSYAELVHPDDLIRVRQELREQIAKQRPQCTHAAYRLRRADRSYIEVADYTRILYRDDGSVAELLGYLVDVTQVRAAEARLKMALEATGAGFWEWEVRTGTTRFDDRWAEIVGYAPGELDQNAIQTWQQLCHPEDLARSDHELQRLFCGGGRRLRVRSPGAAQGWLLGLGPRPRQDPGSGCRWDPAALDGHAHGYHRAQAERSDPGGRKKSRRGLESLEFDVGAAGRLP
jgi:PAS domain-containing protein